MGVPRARRLIRQRRVVRSAQRWARLVAVWLHLIALVAGLVMDAHARQVIATRVGLSTAAPPQPPPLIVARVAGAAPPPVPVSASTSKIVNVPDEQPSAIPASPTAPEAARSARATTPTRSPVSSPEQGRLTPNQPGSDAAPSLGAQQRIGTSDRAARGGGTATHVSQGGQTGSADGGRAATHLVGADDDGAHLPGGAASLRHAPATAVAEARRSDSWRPSVFRARISRPRPGLAITAPSEGEAVATRPLSARDRGSAAAGVEGSRTRPNTSEHRTRTPGPPVNLRELGDPIESLQRDLGWADLIEQARAAHTAPGLQRGPGRRSRSPQVASDDLILSWTAAIDARGTELGAYINRVERLIAERWSELDLSPHARGVGKQGEVVLRYRILSSGRVDEVSVVRSSGVPELDRMAMASVPPRVPRIPRRVELSTLVHEIVLRYRNPLIEF